MRIGSALVLGTLGGVVVAIGRIFGLLEMYVIGTGLAATAIIAIVTTRSRIVLIDVERRTTNREPRVGDDVDVDVTVRAVRRSPGFELSDFITDSARQITGRVDISLPSLRRGQSATSRYRLQPHKRGTITLGPAIVEYGDPLGLSSRHTSVGIADEIVVSPEWTPIALPVPHECEGQLVTAIEGLARNSTSSRDFRSLREYAPGDDARFVNWRATARRDTLIINDYESHAGILIDIFLDDATSSFSSEGFERAVSIAASFVGSADSDDADDIRVRLSFGSRSDSTAFDAMIDDSSRIDAMRALALLDTSEREPQPRRSGDRMALSIPVIICGKRESDWLDEVHRLLQGSSVAVVICCEGSPPSLSPPHWFSMGVEDFSLFGRQWSYLSRRMSSS